MAIAYAPGFAGAACARPAAAGFAPVAASTAPAGFPCVKVTVISQV
jgi:hypothetical protein